MESKVIKQLSGKCSMTELLAEEVKQIGLHLKIDGAISQTVFKYSDQFKNMWE